MTEQEIEYEAYCIICEKMIGTYTELEDIDYIPDLALWAGSHTGDPEGNTYICIGCVAYGYEME